MYGQNKRNVFVEEVPAVTEGNSEMEQEAEQLLPDDFFVESVLSDEVEPEQPDSMMNFHKGDDHKIEVLNALFIKRT